MNKVNFKSQYDLICQILVTVVSFFLLPALYLSLFGEVPTGWKVLSPNKLSVSGQHALGIGSYCKMQQPETVIYRTCFVQSHHKTKAHVLLIAGLKLNCPTLSQNSLTPLLRHQKCHKMDRNIVLRQTAILEGQDKKPFMGEVHRWVGVFECSICWKRPSNMNHLFAMAVVHFQLNCSWQNFPKGCIMTATAFLLSQPNYRKNWISLSDFWVTLAQLFSSYRSFFSTTHYHLHHT